MSLSCKSKETRKEIDDVETMILMALDGAGGYTKGSAARVIGRREKMEKVEIIDQGDFLRFDDMTPKAAYTTDLSDDSRLYGQHPDFLMSHPRDILGDEAEIMSIKSDGTLSWTGYRTARRPPQGVSVLGRPAHWYEAHCRTIGLSGVSSYLRRVIPLDIKGNPLPAKLQGAFVCSQPYEGAWFIMNASLIEDAHRSGSMLAQVKDAMEIKFPVPLGDYREVFAMRDGPMIGDRRKAIIHWVRSHLRRSHQGDVHSVKKHTRGVTDINIDGITVTITPN